MENKKPEEILIGKLLQETFQNNEILGNGDSQHQSFNGNDPFIKIFSEKENFEILKFLQQNNISFSPGIYLQTIGCFRFTILEDTIDFPRNWSVFESLYNSLITYKTPSFYLISREDDQDLIFDVFQAKFPFWKHFIFLIYNSDIYFLGLSESQEGTIQLLECNFERKLMDHDKELFVDLDFDEEDFNVAA